MIKEIKIIIPVIETWIKYFLKDRRDRHVLLQWEKDDKGTEYRFRQFGFAS